ncbi:hypothetical protein DWQ65_02720 [Treponema phagedenis]|uniref:Lipoprotein n=1 Tax=Treponema phagedenis TaxID=162 RepID=A0A0B7H2G2_TREPH|nr:hypothetical protein [Treponema phagedenis]QSH99008.1 hypothetical protein DWQ65_02720 [Treponema phagedenis]CEM63151.1 conserved exported hypothetical protein [Treponema phagedenis]
MKKTNFLVSAALLMVIGLTFVGCGSNIDTGLRKHEMWQAQHQHNLEAEQTLNGIIDGILATLEAGGNAVSKADIDAKVQKANEALKLAEGGFYTKVKAAVISYKGGEIKKDDYWHAVKGEVIMDEDAYARIAKLFSLKIGK